MRFVWTHLAGPLLTNLDGIINAVLVDTAAHNTIRRMEPFMVCVFVL